MSHSKLLFSTNKSSPITFNFYGASKIDFNSLDNLIHGTASLLKHEMCGINDLEQQNALVASYEKVLKLHADKKYFIHVGMGGSVLGAEVLLESLGNHNKNIIFINNLDADYIHEQLKDINLQQALIFVVSKSGNTLETNIVMQILFSKLKNLNALKDKTPAQIYKDHFIFATDPDKGPLRELCKKHDLTCFEIPKNLGGRFCALSSVGFLPALFAKIDVKKIINSAIMTRDFFLKEDKEQSIYKLAHTILAHSDLGLDQTVLMPYSSKLKSFNAWFGQLWAESLGKINKQKENVGLTPIMASGPADQHSQLQLFMQGPKNKFFIFIKILKNTHDLQLKNNPDFLTLLDNKYLSEVVHAQLSGTMSALQNVSRPFVAMEMEQIDEKNIGSFLYFFELLTIIVGAGLAVDPFDQPGVELGKNLTWNYLRDGKSPLLN